MKTRPCQEPIPLAKLVEYWLGELDEADAARVDEHLLGCGGCSASLQELVDIAGGVRSLVERGAVRAVVTNAFLQRVTAQGLRLREYRVPRNGSVNCTVAPDDDLMVARLEAPLAGVERLDLLLLGTEGQGDERLRDVPFDPAAGEVVLTPRIENIRALPASTSHMRLVAVAAEGERVIGDYTFHHTPWAGG